MGRPPSPARFTVVSSAVTTKGSSPGALKAADTRPGVVSSHLTSPPERRKSASIDSALRWVVILPP